MMVFYYIKDIFVGIATRYCDVSGVWKSPCLINCTNEILVNASTQVSWPLILSFVTNIFCQIQVFFKFKQISCILYFFTYIKIVSIIEDGVQNTDKIQETVNNILRLMKNLTSSSNEISAGDLSASLDILEKIVTVTNNTGSTIEEDVSFVLTTLLQLVSWTV